MNKYEKNIKKSNVELAYEFNFQHAKDYGFYDPVMAGSIDGTDEKPHDHGIIRALESTHYKPNSTVKSNPDKTLFIGRINYKTNEETLLKIFSKFGSIRSFRLVRDIVTGLPKGYAFVEYKHQSDAKYAYEKCHRLIVDDRELIVDLEYERNLEGWIPRRFGGGFGGFKESGQLRFGGRHKPFSKIYQPSVNSFKSN